MADRRNHLASLPLVVVGFINLIFEFSLQCGVLAVHYLNFVLEVSGLLVLLEQISFHFEERFLFEGVDVFDLFVNLELPFFKLSVLHFQVQESHSDPVHIASTRLAKLFVSSHFFKELSVLFVFFQLELAIRQ